MSDGVRSLSQTLLLFIDISDIIDTSYKVVFTPQKSIFWFPVPLVGSPKEYGLIPLSIYFCNRTVTVLLPSLFSLCTTTPFSSTSYGHRFYLTSTFEGVVDPRMPPVQHEGIFMIVKCFVTQMIDNAPSFVVSF